MLAETKRVVHHRDSTFSFILASSKKIRIDLNKAGIKYLGGLDKLESFVEEIKSGKRKTKISKNAIRALENVICLAKIMH